MHIDTAKIREEIENGFPSLEIDAVQTATTGIIICWSCRYIGFGQMHIWADEQEQLHVNTEGMSKDFIAAVFKKLLGEMIIEDF